MSQATLPDRQMVSVEELKRAWAAVRAGGFRANTLGQGGASPVTRAPRYDRWQPGDGERVLPVLGCSSSTGATTLAVALASAAGVGARVVECSSVTASGLAAASTAELGTYEGWSRGSRGNVLLERGTDILANPEEIPHPATPDRPLEVTVLDIGWELGQVLTTPGWIGHTVRGPGRVVLTTTATIPGMRRAAGALELLDGVPVCLAVLGPRRKSWPKGLEHTGGPAVRELERDGLLVHVPYDPALAHQGVTGQPLPKPVLAAAHLLIERLLGEATKGTIHD